MHGLPVRGLRRYQLPAPEWSDASAEAARVQGIIDRAVEQSVAAAVLDLVSAFGRSLDTLFQLRDAPSCA
jgi:hypothetical protein